MRRLRTDDAGQDLVEYALLLALIALQVIVGLTLVGPQISQALSDFGQEMIRIRVEAEGADGPVATSQDLPPTVP